MIELIIVDVDGTMTNGQITYSASGEELKSFCVKDGLALVSWKKLNKKIAIITGRESSIVEKRAKELQVDFLYQKIKNKSEKVEEILKELNLSWENVAVIGDDLNDYSMFVQAKYSFTPKNASSYMKKIATFNLANKGGEGAVREMIEILIKLEGLEEEFLNLWVAK